ncbi:MAG: hypothetical protein ACRDAM_08860 [Casimicrobium sp.]
MKSLYIKNYLAPRLRVALCALLVCATAGCATTRPVLLAADKSKATGERSERAIESCVQSADRDVGRNGFNGPVVAKRMGKAGAIEFAEAAAENSVKKSSGVLRRAAGAASGGAAGVATRLLFEWNEPDKVNQKYVEHCLEKRGHRVLGWR